MLQEQVIAYCERTDFAYWGEPVNAVTNAAFVIAAALVWRQTAGLPLARAMAVVLAAIGLGSFLWHTHATQWAGLADVLPILGFILLYLFAATRDYFRVSGLAALGVTLLFFPYAAGFGWAVSLVLPGMGANALYLSVAVLIAGYGLWLNDRDTGKGLLIGAGLLVVSLGFRMADDAVCAIFPIGTHFMWHLVNAVMLGWMIRKHSPRAVWLFSGLSVYRVSLWTHTRTPPAFKFCRFLTRAVAAVGRMMRRSGSLKKAIATA